MRSMIITICLVFTGLTPFNEIYSIHITTINGDDRALEDFRGKKILVVIVPVTKTADDSIFLRTIYNISTTYAETLSVIAVPSFEDGYDTANTEDLKIYYNSLLGSNVTVTAGMNTRRVTPNQHPLFSWLTHKEENIHFDSDTEGVEESFFINEQGELYGTVSPNVGLTDRLLQRMMQ